MYWPPLHWDRVPSPICWLRTLERDARMRNLVQDVSLRGYGGSESARSLLIGKVLPISLFLWSNGTERPFSGIVRNSDLT